MGVACFVEDDVVWLEVSIDDVVTVQLFNREDDLSCVDPSMIFSKSAYRSLA
jgi:hypothetical protein